MGLGMLQRNRRYAQDYQAKTVMTKGGKVKTEYVYTGTRYILQVEDDNYKRLLAGYTILCIVLAAAFLLAGLLNTESSRTFYVILPYGIAVIPITYIIMGTVRLVRGERSKTKKDYDYSVLRIQKSAAGAMVLMVMTVIGEIILLIRGSGAGIPIGEILFLGAVTAASVVLLFMQNLRKKYSVTEEAGEVLPDSDAVEAPPDRLR